MFFKIRPTVHKFWHFFFNGVDKLIKLFAGLQLFSYNHTRAPHLKIQLLSDFVHL